MLLNPDFWKGRRVLLTGHTGFKGSWTSLCLEQLGAQVSGISLSPSTEPNLFKILSPWPHLSSTICDIRDGQRINEIVGRIDPEIVFHMAAQPLVRESYRDPLATIEINVMGTVRLLESLRSASNLLAVLVITTDKVYLNHNEPISLSESSPLGGFDPYSASKAASEIVTAAYAQSFFNALEVPMCTARAGNVIGGGDWSIDRIIPDLWRAYKAGHPVALRYPNAVRPWQHVLDPVYGYLLYLEYMASTPTEMPRALNFGPPIQPLRTVLDLAKSFSSQFEASHLFTIGESDPKYHENHFLSIDASLAKRTLGWRSILNVDTAIDWTCRWYRAFEEKKDMRRFSHSQILEYFDLVNTHASSTAAKLLSRKQTVLKK